MVVMTTFPPPTEGLHHVQDKTEAFIHDKSCGVGTLYIAAEWVKSNLLLMLLIESQGFLTTNGYIKPP